MRDFLSALETLGFERNPSQTAGEFMGGLSALVPGLDLSGELFLFERARYGKLPLAEEDTRSLRQGLAVALEQIKLGAKPRSRRQGASVSRTDA